MSTPTVDRILVAQKSYVVSSVTGGKDSVFQDFGSSDSYKNVNS